MKKLPDNKKLNSLMIRKRTAEFLMFTADSRQNGLEENSVTEKFSVTAGAGKIYRTKHYNLDAIIAIRYRVNSMRATQFRQWAPGCSRSSPSRVLSWTKNA